MFRYELYKISGEFMSEHYPNVPATDHHSPLLKVEELPSNIKVFENGIHSVHIVKERDIYHDGDLEKLVCICGREFESIFKLNYKEEDYVIEGFCKDCLSKFDDMMEEAMYDSFENEWYFVE